MRMVITAHGFDLTEDLRADVEREIERLAQGLDRSINVVAVHLFDEQEHRCTGEDKRCCVQVEFDEGVCVIDDDAEPDFRDSVPVAFTKVLRASMH